MAGPRFTLSYAVLVLAWCAQLAWVLGLAAPHEPSWIEIALLLGTAAVAPVAPDGAIPFMVALPVIGILIAAGSAP